MRTFIYDIINQKRVGEIRQGWCMMGNEPCVIPDGYVELEIKERPYPSIDNSIQTVERVETANVTTREWVIDWAVRNLTPEEIEAQKVQWWFCTPRQFRLALLTKNSDPNYVDNLLNTIQDENEKVRAKIEWEYAVEIERDHPMIQVLAQNLNMNSSELNDFFEYANSL